MTNFSPGPLTDDVLLRDVSTSDLPIFFEHQLDPEAVRMAAFPSRDQDAFMAHWTRILADETITKQTIQFNGIVAGNIVCFEQSGEREIGYWIGREYWGQGIATRALSAFLGQVKTRPLYAYVAKHNLASTRVLEKCGFTIIGEDQDFSSDPREQVEGFILKLGPNDQDEAQ